MATPPTRVLSVLPPDGWASQTSPKTSTPFDVQAGDLIVVMAISQHSSYPLSPATWDGVGAVVSRQSAVVSNYCLAYLYSIEVGATQTGRTVTVARTSGTNGFFSFMVTVWRNHGGLGATGKANTRGAPSLDLACSANSAVSCAVGDWDALNTARTWRTINGSPMAESSYNHISSSTYTVYTGYSLDAGAAGAKTLGLTAPSAQKYTIIGAEVLGSTAAAPSEGIATGTISRSGSAAGASPAVPSADGFAVGAVARSGAAAGITTKAGTATGQHAISGAAAGHAVHEGTASSIATHGGTASGSTATQGTAASLVAYEGAGTGSAPPIPGSGGQATGQITRTGSTTGSATMAGAATGSVARTGSAAGVAPSVDGREGAASGQITLAGTASGTAARRGAAEGSVVRTGSASGSADPIPANVGTASGTINHTGTASGRAGEPVVAVELGPARWSGSMAVGSRALAQLEGKRWEAGFEIRARD